MQRPGGEETPRTIKDKVDEIAANYERGRHEMQLKLEMQRLKQVRRRSAAGITCLICGVSDDQNQDEASGAGESSQAKGASSSQSPVCNRGSAHITVDDLNGTIVPVQRAAIA